MLHKTAEAVNNLAPRNLGICSEPGHPASGLVALGVARSPLRVPASGVGLPRGVLGLRQFAVGTGTASCLAFQP